MTTSQEVVIIFLRCETVNPGAGFYPQDYGGLWIGPGTPEDLSLKIGTDILLMSTNILADTANVVEKYNNAPAKSRYSPELVL